MKAFLRYYIELPYPAKELDAVIAGLPGEWLDLAAREANIRGLLMLGSARTTPEQEADGEVCVTIGAPQLQGAVLRRTIAWGAVRGNASSPVLRGDLELAELGPGRTQLALSAQYRPSVRAADGADRLTMQRVGESTLKAFLDQLATYIHAILGRAPAAIAATEPWPTIEGRPRPGTVG